MTDCQHEFDPMPSEMIVVTEEMAMKEPLRFDWSPPSIVMCKKCGAPINRGRFTGMTSHPWAGLGVPLRYPGYDAAREVERLRVEMKRLETENEHLRDQLANCKGQLQAKAAD